MEKKEKLYYDRLNKLVDDIEKAYWEKKDDFFFNVWKEATDHLNPCGKPHNNGRDTCEECLTIKEGI